MAAYLTTDDVDAIVGATERQSFFTDAGAYNSALFTKINNLASALGQAAAQNAGYSASSDNDMVKAMTLGAFVRLMYGRKQLEVPKHTLEVLGGLLEGVRVGEVPIPGLSPDAQDAVGGNDISPQSATSASGRPAVFNNKGLRKVF